MAHVDTQAFAKSVAAQYHHIDTNALSTTLLRQKCGMEETRGGSEVAGEYQM
jgi:hypothetical protein